MKQLESLGAFITTLDNKRMGVALLVLLLILGGMGYSCFILYNEAINTKNDSIKEQKTLIVKANEALRLADNKIVEMQTIIQGCKEENKDLKNLLKGKIK